MFYPSNDNYMQDFYFYNQVPVGTYNLENNPDIMPNYPNNYNNINNNVLNMQYNQTVNRYQNFSQLYPSIYKIIKPVTKSVIMSSNYQYLNEEILNNMTDTVFNIVVGQLHLESGVQGNINNTNSTKNLNDKNVGLSSNMNDTSKKLENIDTENTESAEEVVKDLIKILVIDELKTKQMNRNYNMQPYAFAQPNFMNY